jgi:hypothetical protein
MGVKASRELGILAIIAHGLFTVPRATGYTVPVSPYRLRRVAVEEIGRKETSKRSAALRGSRLAGVDPGTVLASTIVVRRRHATAIPKRAFTTGGFAGAIVSS